MKMRHKKMARCAMRHTSTQRRTTNSWDWNPKFFVIARWERQFNNM